MDKRPCILCGKGDRVLTREHTPPLWVTQLLKDHDPRFTGAEFRAERHGVDYGLPGHASDVVRVVCEECRVWVNTTIEEPGHYLMPPLLSSNTAAVTADDAVRIATWIAYHSMMRAVGAQDPAFGGFAASDYRELREAGTPPVSHAIWIGSKASMRSVARAAATPWSVGQATRRVYSSIVRLSLVHAVDIVAGGQLRHEGEVDGFLTRVWPRPTTFSWPPSKQLSPHEVERMRRTA